jgi:MFS family permease
MQRDRTETSVGIWTQPGFRNLWLGLTTSEFGSQVARFALPLIAVLALDATAEQVGILGALTQLPYLLIALFAGVFVDRLSPRRMLITADASRLALLALVPLLYLTDTFAISWLYVVGFLVGCCTVVFDIGSQSMLPQLMPARSLAAGNGALEASRSASIIAGPAAGGALVQLLGAPVAVGASAAVYLASTIAIWRTPPTAPAGAAGAAGGIFRQIWSGLRVVFGNEILRVMAIVAGIYNLFFTGFQTVNLLFLARELNLSAGAIGLGFAALGPGLLVGATCAAWLTRRVGYGKTIMVTAVGANGIVQLVPVLHGNGVATVASLIGINVAFGAFGMAHAIVMRTIRQVMTPAAYQGRVAATNRFIAQGATPIGALFGGFIAGVLDLRLAVLLMTMGMFGVVFILGSSRLPRIGHELPTLDLNSYT